MNNNLTPPTNKLSKAFASIATISYDHAKLIILLTIIGMSLVMFNINQLRTELSLDGQLEESNPVRINYNSFRELFGRDDLITISLPVPNGINEETAQVISALQNKLEADVPYLKEITSILNTRMSYGDNDELIVEDILEYWPEKPFATRWPDDSLESYLLNNPTYLNRLISSDASHIAIAIELHSHAKNNKGELHTLEQQQISEAMKAIYKTLEDSKLKDKVIITGLPAVNDKLSDDIFTGTILTGSIATFLIIGFLWVFFKRASGVFIPMTVVNCSLLAAIGFMLLNDTPWSLALGVLPPILLAIGIADAVHILTVFYKNYHQPSQKREAVILAVSQSAPAVLLTSITTATGFASFATAELVSTADLGTYSAIAVCFALLFSVILIPAILAVLKIKAHQTSNSNLQLLDRFSTACVKLSCQYPKAITAVATLMLIAGMGNAALNLTLSENVIKNFPNSERIRTDFEEFDQLYNGIGIIEIIIDTQEAQGVHEPEFLQKLEALDKKLTHSTMSNVTFDTGYSILNIIKETHQALNNNDKSFYTLPDNKALISQELLLFEMSERDDLLKVTDEDARIARLSFKLMHADSMDYHIMISHLQKQLDQTFGNGNSYITGSSAITAESIPRMLTSMLKSYGFALLIITVFMGVMISSFRIGIISMLPNLLPIVLVLNLMILLDWPLDQTTISIGAIALGLVVDDSLHFMYHFKQQWLKLKHGSQAALAAIKHCGSALIITTIAFGSATLTNLLSPLVPFTVFAICLSSIAFLALLIDLLVAPAALTLAFNSKKTAQD